MNAGIFDDRPIRRVQIGTERPPARSPTEEQAQRLADRAATESRLKGAEALWRTVQQAAGGGCPVITTSGAQTAADFIRQIDGWIDFPDDFYC